MAIAAEVYFDAFATQCPILWFPAPSFYCLCHGPSI